VDCHMKDVWKSTTMAPGEQSVMTFSTTRTLVSSAGVCLAPGKNCCFVVLLQPFLKARMLIIIIIIIIIPGQCLWCCHHAVATLQEFTLVHTMSAARRQVAADL